MSIQITSHTMPGDKIGHLVGNELLKAEIQTVQSHSKHKESYQLQVYMECPRGETCCPKDASRVPATSYVMSFCLGGL